MQVLNHGGHCCGVKHIIGFPARPDYQCWALTERTVYQGAGREMDNPAKDFYPGPAPAEPGTIRLDRLLEYIDKKKTGHLVEVILSSYVSSHWKTTLEERGFVLVTKFKNSNTDMDLHVYHRVIPVKKLTKKETD